MKRFVQILGVIALVLITTVSLRDPVTSVRAAVDDGPRASELPRCPTGTVRTEAGCNDPTEGGFTDRGDHTETLYIYRDGVRTMIPEPWGTLASGRIPYEALPTHGASAVPARMAVPTTQWKAPNGNIIKSGLDLESTTCKTIDVAYVYDYVCFYRYSYSNGDSDPNKNYNTVWTIGISQGQGNDDSDCNRSGDYRCLQRVRNKFTINEKSDWCDSSSDNCAVDTSVAPSTCCTYTGDGVTKTASLNLQFGGFGASISSTFATYVDRYGLENLKWSVDSHDWWSIASVVGRGRPIYIDRHGGGEYYWSQSKTRPPATYYANAWDNYGFMYTG